MRKTIICVLVSLGISNTIHSQKPVEVSLKLRDGSNVSGTTSMNDIPLITDYGKLVIPIKNISSIKVGIPGNKATNEKAKTYLDQLSSSNEDMKKSAYAELINLGIKAIQPVSDFISDPKNQMEYSGDFTPDNALNELKSNANIDDITNTKDIISIDGEYTMGGIYEFAKLDIKTEYGNLSIPKEKI
ncbi:MAG TPA: hypothetical protein VNX68_05415, partial [Nitrosopumilaceae archaeon]|nr:hypothetical protein [Nitrosopumilaceae archaeon]